MRSLEEIKAEKARVLKQIEKDELNISRAREWLDVRDKEMEDACPGHIDDGRMFHGCCTLCGKLLG